MTPEEHAAEQLRAQLVAKGLLLDWVLIQLRLHWLTLPTETRALLLSRASDQVHSRSQEFEALAFEDQHPAVSDLKSGLFQEAYREYAAQVLQALAAEATPEERQILGQPHLK